MKYCSSSSRSRREKRANRTKNNFNSLVVVAFTLGLNANKHEIKIGEKEREVERKCEKSNI